MLDLWAGAFGLLFADKFTLFGNNITIKTRFLLFNAASRLCLKLFVELFPSLNHLDVFELQAIVRCKNTQSCAHISR